MDVPVLHRLEPSPYRVGADRGMKAPIDREDHIGLPGEELLGGDLDDRARRGILGDDIARAEEVNDLAGDRAGDRRLEAGRSACDIDARRLGSSRSPPEPGPMQSRRNRRAHSPAPKHRANLRWYAMLSVFQPRSRQSAPQGYRPAPAP